MGDAVTRVLSIAVALLCLCDIAPAQNQQTWGSMMLMSSYSLALDKADDPLGITNLVAHWLMNDNTTNTTIRDNYTNSLNATATTNTSFMASAGKRRGALGFSWLDKTGATVADNAALKPDHVSFGAWMYLTNGNSNARLIEKGLAAVDYALVSSGDSFYGLVYDSFGDYIQNYWGSYLLTKDEWHHMFVVYDGVAGTLKMYVDGVLYRTDYGAPGRTCRKSTGSVYIGRDLNNAASGYFGGRIDDLRVYGRALTSNEVFTIYNGGVGTEGE
jgi:hypothetical protein